MHTYGAVMSPPSLVQQVWWRDRLDQQHDGVVLMVEISAAGLRLRVVARERTGWQQLGWRPGLGEGEAAPQPSLI
jgi:hypothetical protein